MEELQSKTTSKSTLSDILKLMSGTVIAQALPILISPVLSRLYEPLQFGYLTTYYSVINILSALVCLRYDQGIILPREDRKAANVFWLGVIVTGVISVILFLLYLVFQTTILMLLQAEELGNIFQFIGPILFFSGLNLILSSWSTRQKKFWRISSRLVINTLILSVVQILIPVLGLKTPLGLVYGVIAGAIAAAVILAIEVWREDKAKLTTGMDWIAIRSVAVEYKKFPLIETWSYLMNTLSWQAPGLLLSLFFGQTVVGYYGLGYKVLVMPMALLGVPIAQVFSQRAVVEKESQSLGIFVEKVFQQLVKLGLFPLLLVAIIGPEAFSFVFNSSWVEAGRYAQILSVWIFFVFISSPISSLYFILNKQEVGLAFNIVALITRVLSIVVGGLIGDIDLTLFLFSITGVLLYIWATTWLLKSAGVLPKQIALFFLQGITRGLPFLLVVLAVKLLLHHSTLTLITAGICGGLYYFYILIKDQEIRGFIEDFIKKKSTGVSK